jgi:phthalate 4,5-dioxygenase oxygenase subunit
MLPEAENKLLTQVGPGTPMGTFMRRYWTPALASSELSEPNGAPVRVRLLGENLVAWRDASGRVGVFDEYCMHRGTSLALGRCEGDGLRCLYHGWKYATDGRILETPNYKKSIIMDKLRAPAYPVREAGDLIWVYLGPPEKEPPFPRFKFMECPPAELDILKYTVDCSFVQVMEASIDAAHLHLLHRDDFGRGFATDGAAGTNEIPSLDTHGVAAASFHCEDDAPTVLIEDTTFGFHGGFIFDAIADGRPTNYVRLQVFVLPWLAMPSPGTYSLNIPVDDDHTNFYTLQIDPRFADPSYRERLRELVGGPASNYENGRFRWTAKEHWGQDRAKMGGRYTGIEGVIPEDLACVLSMGPVDRSKENLVPADQMIIRMRRRLLQAARDLQAGTEPIMFKDAEGLAVGGLANLLDDPSEWSSLAPAHEPFRLPKKQGSGGLANPN